MLVTKIRIPKAIKEKPAFYYKEIDFLIGILVSIPYSIPPSTK